MTQALSGRRVLIVEDESLVAMLLETILEDMGCTPVGPASTVDEGMELITGGESLDAALLDALKEHPTKAAASAVAEALGLPKRDVYQRALQLKANG